MKPPKVKLRRHTARTRIFLKVNSFMCFEVDNRIKFNERNRIFSRTVIIIMIRKSILSLLISISSLSLFAQTIKTDVTVAGGTAAGISAGIQAARSGVRSLIIEEGSSLNPEFGPGDLLTLERIRDHYIYKQEAEEGRSDSVQRPAVTPANAVGLLRSITDTVKNLTVILNTGIREIKKDGKGWEIKLKNGRTVKTDVVIDAQAQQVVASLLKIVPEQTIIQVGNWITSPQSTPKLFRSSLGWGTRENAGKSSAYLIPAATLMPVAAENIFLIPQAAKGLQPQSMLAGQAAGASAAFCAFFKTTSKNLNIRITQGEMLAYDARIIPYADIDFNDRHALALQHTGLSGILKARSRSGGDKEEFVFDTSGTISSEELRLPMKEFYSRSQLWFADHKKDSLTIEDAISLLMFTATRGDELKREIESGWKNSLKFSTAYDPKRPITRREFAVLTDRYLQPFNNRIDFSGNLLN